jgi:hypothetical protein
VTGARGQRRGELFRLVIALGIAQLAAGCAPTYHTAPVYRFDHVRASALESRAAQACSDLGQPAGPPDRAFATDGCTLWFDGWWTGRTWQQCCVEHDIAYWCGGSREQRRTADDELRACVAAEYDGWMGAVMWLGSRVAAHPEVPAHWRWGYGVDDPAPY